MTVIDDTHLELLESPSYVWLEGDMGYVFLQSAAVKLFREPRGAGTTYFTMAVDHGESPVNEGYAYIMMPGATLNETELVAENSGVEVLSATNDMHAVRDLTTGKIYVNAFSAKQRIDDVLINMPCSLILTPLGENIGYIVNISDPTTENGGLSLTFDRYITSCVGETTVFSSNTVTVSISNDRSKVYEFTVYFE